MDKKTRYIQVRLTPAQFEQIKKRSATFGSMSNLVIQALKEFSDSTAKDRLELSRLLAERYAKLDADIAHIGGNLNQAMHRINERAIAQINFDPILTDELYPLVQGCYDLCKSIRDTLRENTIPLIKG